MGPGAWAEVDALGTGSTYLNFTGPEDPVTSSVPHAFGRNLDRLIEVKARYDPGNLFQRNNNIQPSAAGGSGPRQIPAGR